jgi:hypothetical protein
VSRVSRQVGSDSGAVPANESYFSQEVAIPAPREREPPSEVVAHTPLEPCSPIALDVLDAVEDDGHIVITRACRPAIESHECVAQLACGRCPARWQ